MPEAKKKKKDSIEIFEKEFEILRAEIRDYKPEAFDYLEKRFFEFYRSEKLFSKQCKKDLKESKNPAKEWIKINNYPIDKFEVKILKACSLLTKASKENFLRLLDNYLFMIKNSEGFKRRCERLKAQGFNPLMMWLDRFRFKPAFKESASSCQK